MKINCKKVIEKISDWTAEKVTESHTQGVVVGLSGGVDSSVVLGLAKRAVGESSLGVIMPCHSRPEDAEDAQKAAKAFGVEVITIDLDNTFDTMIRELPPTDELLVQANIKARLRMTALYSIANLRGYLVAGTGNRSELKVGYFTKYGDGGADILPIGELLKTEVRELARELGVPQCIIDKPPSAGLWEGQTDEKEMGIDYPTLDKIIVALDEQRRPDAPDHLVKRVQSLAKASEHKLKQPPVCEL